VARTNYGRELWNSLLPLVEEDDGLPALRTQGMWTAKKLYFVCQYLEQFTRGMKNSRTKFPSGLTYVDLFCGTGVSQVEVMGERVRRYPGSPLIAANTPTPFDRLILIDKDPRYTEALRQRLSSAAAIPQIDIHTEDANLAAPAIADRVPHDSLNVMFVDPYSLDIHYETIRRIASTKSMDLLILFSDRFDLGRNVYKYYYPAHEHTKLDRFLGTTNWREQLDQLDDQSGANVRRLFAGIYEHQLEKIGYRYHDRIQLDGPQGPVFTLLYASKHELGLTYCHIAAKEDFEGSRNLFG
jgi:three-Cys-motif partner protein